MNRRSRSPSPRTNYSESSMRSRSPRRIYNRSPERSETPYRNYHGRSRSPPRSYYGRSRSPPVGYYGRPGYGNWSLGAASGLVLGTALGAAINPYPYYVPAYGLPYRPVEYDIYGRPIIYY